MKTKKKGDYFLDAFLVILIIVLFLGGFRGEMKKKGDSERILIREPAAAGMFYPDEKDALSLDIRERMNKACKREGRAKALIVPHAGYIYSGMTAACAFKHVSGEKYKTVVLLGPSHYAYFKGASIPEATHYRTPLGLVKISDAASDIISDLKKEGLYADDSRIHEKEHSIEVEIPFLQEALSDFEIIPIAIGPDASFDDLKKIANVIKRYTDDKTLLVASSDFTHYGPNYGYVPFSDNVPENIKKLDFGAIKYIESLNARGFYDYVKKTGATVCGRHPITVLLLALEGEYAKAKLVHYETSGNLTGNYVNSVSYAGIVFYAGGDGMEEGKSADFLDEGEKRKILELARMTLESYLSSGRIPKVDESAFSQKLKEERGCFVTLNKGGNLRGCIGHIFPVEPLYKSVMDNAVNAAVNDPRFPPMTIDELNDVKIEISVLTVPRALEHSSPEDLLEKLVPHRDGVVLRRGFYQSTFLPQVWEQLPDKVEFLEHLCMKGGMGKDCWKNGETEVLVYQAQVFSED